MASRQKGSGDDPIERARRLMARVRHKKLVQALFAWKDLAEFETTIRTMQEQLAPYQVILEKDPQNRSPRDVRKLAKLVSQVSAYRSFSPPVCEFIATYCSLLVVWDSIELPRTADEANCVFSVVSGRMRCIAADSADPVLRCMVQKAADQMVGLDIHDQPSPEMSVLLRPSMEGQMLNRQTGPGLKAQQQASAGPPSPTKRVQLAPTPGSIMPGSKGGRNSVKAGSPTTKIKKVPRSDTTDHYGLPDFYLVPSIHNRLWHTVVDMIHLNRVPQRKDAEDYWRLRGGIPPPRSTGGASGPGAVPGAGAGRVSFAGTGPAVARPAAQGDVPLTPSGLPDGASDSAGGSRQRARQGGRDGTGTFAAINLLDLGVGSSFSGRELDCRTEAGLIEDPNLEFPPRCLAAITAHNSMAALLVVPKPVYKRALKMQQELSVARAVDACCRLPFLRHTPLKELYKLSKHAIETRYTRGDPILTQGSDCTSVFFLLEGEVEVVVDVPLTQDKELLESALFSAVSDGYERSESIAGSPAGPRAPAHPQLGRSRSARHTYTGPLQRVVLARRGPGSVLGDDALRDKKMAVSVVVSSPEAVTLHVSQQRFTMSVDPLTLRLFHKLRGQQGALTELSSAVADVSKREAMLTKCREAVLMQTYDTSIIPNTLIRARKLPGAEYTVHRWQPTRAVGGHFSELLSLDTGERALDLAADAEARASAARMAVLMEKGAASPGPGSGGAKDASNIGAPGSRGNSRQGGPGSGGGAGPGASPWNPGQLPTGICSAWLGNTANAGESLEKLANMIKEVETKRAADLAQLKQLKREHGIGADLIKAPPSVVRKLDLAEALAKGGGEGAQRMHTEMHECACLAIIQVVKQEGQAEVGSDVLAPVLDDAVVTWSSTAHAARLHLVRWSANEYYLLGGLDPSERRRPLVRVVADALLEMRETLEGTIALNPVPHFVFCASMVLGGLFTSHMAGRFLTGVSGQAYTAAQLLVKDAVDLFGKIGGGILVSDAVMQATNRTHVLRFAGPAYELQGRVELPYETSFDVLYGAGAVEREPVSPGLPSVAHRSSQMFFSQAGFGSVPSSPSLTQRSMARSISFFKGLPDGLLPGEPEKSSHFVEMGVGGVLSLDDGLVNTVTSNPGPPVSNGMIQPNRIGAVPLAGLAAALQHVGGGAPSGPSSGSLGSPHISPPGSPQRSPSPTEPGRPGGLKGAGSRSNNLRHTTSFAVPPGGRDGRKVSSAGKPLTGGVSLETLERASMSARSIHELQRMPSARARSIDTPKRPPVTSSANAQAQSAFPVSLEPRLKLTRVQEKRDAVVLRTKMNVRDQLRSEIRAMVPSYPSPYDKSRMPHAVFQPGKGKAGPPAFSLGGTHQTTTFMRTSASAAAGAATAHLGITAQPSMAHMLPTCPSTLAPAGSTGAHAVAAAAAQHQQHGFRSKTSAEALANISPGRAAGQDSPHPPVVHSMTPYGPGSGPLASLSARRRTADVLFAGSAAVATANASIKDLSIMGHVPASRGSRPTSPVASLAEGVLAHAAIGAAINAAVASSQRPTSPLSAPRHLAAEQQQAVAAVAAVVRPLARSHTPPGTGPPLHVASPSLRPMSPPRSGTPDRMAGKRPVSTRSRPASREASPDKATPDRPGSRGGAGASPPAGRPRSASALKGMVASNYGLVPLSELQAAAVAGSGPGSPAGSRPGSQGNMGYGSFPAGGGAAAADALAAAQAVLQQQKLRDTSSPPRSASVAAGGHGQGQGGGASAPGSRPGSPPRPGAGSAKAAYQAAVAKGAARQVDKMTGMTQATIHKQAVATWKDLGSQRAATEYVSHLPQGIVNVSFSTASLGRLPQNLSRLPYLESLAASFNMFGEIDAGQLAGLAPYLKILSLSSCMISQLPESFGSMLPSLTELHLSHNSLTQLPDSICFIPKLRALSVERNQLPELPFSLWHMTALEVLYAGHNALEELPDCLDNLDQLTLLNVSHNQLVGLPSSITALTRLTELAASHNMLPCLPEGTLSSLVALRSLDLEENRLCCCPEVNGAFAVADGYQEEDDTMSEFAGPAGTGAGGPGSPSLLENDSPQQAGASPVLGSASPVLMGRGASTPVPGQAPGSVGASTGSASTGQAGSAGAATVPPAAATTDAAGGAPGSAPAAAPEAALQQQRSASPNRQGSPNHLRVVIPSMPDRVSSSGPTDALAAAAAAGGKAKPGSVRAGSPGKHKGAEGQMEMMDKRRDLSKALSTKAGNAEQQQQVSSAGGAGTGAGQAAAAAGAAEGGDQAKAGEGDAAAAAAKPTTPAVQGGAMPLPTIAEDSAAAAPTGPSFEERLAQAEAAEAVGEVAQCLPSLLHLNLSGNQLVKMPGWLPGSLLSLDISRNSLVRVPDWLCTRLTGLGTLSLHNNRIKYVPRAMASMTSLYALSLAENPVTDPAENPGPEGGARWATDFIYTMKYERKMQATGVATGGALSTTGAGSASQGAGGSSDTASQRDNMSVTSHSLRQQASQASLSTAGGKAAGGAGGSAANAGDLSARGQSQGQQQ